MKILITGGTGFVGTQLTSRLIQDNHEVTILTRSRKGTEKVSTEISYLEGDPTKKGSWQEAIKNHGAVINLAGASIFSKWTEEHKKAIRESRVNTTRNIVEGTPSHTESPLTLLSTSAVGYYGFCGDEELTEESPYGNNFLARIAKVIKFIETEMRSKGVTSIHTEVKRNNYSAQTFWEKAGFQKYDRFPMKKMIDNT